MSTVKPNPFLVVTFVLALAGCGSTEASSEAPWSSAHSALGAAWQSTGAMAESRIYFTATALPSGKVLAVGGWSYNSYLATAEVHDPATGVWTATGAMTTPRQAHTASLLQSGKVLVAGGENFGGYTAQAELYDPAAGTWAPAGALSRARGYATATVLQSGNVLVAGGHNSGGAWNTADVYNPSTGTWSSTALMKEPRRSHTATRLPSGKVLVAGGWGGTATATAELYDPATGTWTLTGAMATARYDHTATLLPSGKVLVAGGQNGNGRTATAELYDPATGTWSSTGPMATPRAFHAATLASGNVLVSGGQDTAPLGTVETYDPATGTWSSASSLGEARWLHGAVLLESARKVLVVGGRGNATLVSAEVLDVAAPASCKEIRDLGRSTGDGRYTIDPDGTGPAQPFDVYCDMTRDGGGWTLAAMMQTSGSVLGYASSHWTSATVLNPGVLTPTTDVDMKNMAFNTAAFSNVRFCLGSPANCLVDARSAPSALALFSGPFASAPISRATFMAWDPLSDSIYSAEPYCNTAGYNIVLGSNFYIQCRFGLIMNNENDCGTPDAAIGFGCFRGLNSSSIGAGSVSWTPAGGGSQHPQRGWIFIR